EMVFCVFCTKAGEGPAERLLVELQVEMVSRQNTGLLMKSDGRPHSGLPQDEEETLETNQEYPSYTAYTLIKKKLIFKTRPKPIITNVPKKV
uniref:Uncharacterized protein n=1 Tax=Cyprinus carpio carpio TaxID=630221 RepID=A0A8C1HGB0_CYPCA